MVLFFCCELWTEPEPVEDILFVTSTSSVNDIIFFRRDAEEREDILIENWKLKMEINFQFSVFRFQLLIPHS